MSYIVENGLCYSLNNNFKIINYKANLYTTKFYALWSLDQS
jgi:hypothetical protein